MITYDINLCIGRDSTDARPTIKCHDTGVNFLVRLFEYKEGKWRDEYRRYSIPKGATAVVKIAKPDSTFCLFDGKIEGASDVLFTPPPQAFTVEGEASAEVAIFNTSGKRITSATFTIEVAPEALCGCDEESENYIDVFAEERKKVQEAAESAEKAADRAEDASAHQPTIGDNGNWHTWDAEKQEYVDTGWLAVGKDGKDGADGHTPVKGTDYYTETEKAELVDEIEQTVTGDIDKALDEIIELQEAHISGDIGNLPMWQGGSY